MNEINENNESNDDEEDEDNQMISTLSKNIKYPINILIVDDT